MERIRRYPMPEAAPAAILAEIAAIYRVERIRFAQVQWPDGEQVTGRASG